ncbi:MAG TPA: hypothetical protein VNK03_05115 [Gammaproteobacteria bacterium]|nr:hypothetical protein [Gammaproteobacteria bacterium]
MNDESKSPDAGQVDETFNEEFDFGEGETQSHPMAITTSNGRNKKIIGFIFAIVVMGALIMGYRAYSPKLFGSKNPLNTATLTKKPVPGSTTNPRPTPKNVTETPEEIKKQSDEFAAAFSGVTSAEPNPAIVSVPTPGPAPAPIATTSNPLEAEKNMPLEAAEAAKLHEALNKLNTQIDSILSQVKYLDAYSREVSDNLNKLNESISTMDDRLLALTNTTSTLSKDVGTVKSEVGHVREVLREDGLDINPASLSKGKQARVEKEGQVTIAEPEYIVHAVVPGRAWLKSSKGQIVTVAEGDSIGNYGKILVIDAANGVVLTSSGVAFR